MFRVRNRRIFEDLENARFVAKNNSWHARRSLEKNVNSGVKELKPSFGSRRKGTRRSRGRCGEEWGVQMEIRLEQ